MVGSYHVSSAAPEAYFRWPRHLSHDTVTHDTEGAPAVRSRALPAADQAPGPRASPRWTRRLQDRITPWLLSAAERGNDAAGISAWSAGNAVPALVHGRTYFPALAQAVADCGGGDGVFLAGWRVDPDQLLDDDGPSVSTLLVSAAQRGVVVRGLLWHSHRAAFGYSLEAHRELAARWTMWAGRSCSIIGCARWAVTTRSSWW